MNKSADSPDFEIPQAAGTPFGSITLLLGGLLPLLAFLANRLSIPSKILIRFPSFSTLVTGGWMSASQVGAIEWCLTIIFLCRLLAIFPMKERYKNIFAQGVSTDLARQWRVLIRRTFVGSLVMIYFALYSATGLSRDLSAKFVVCYVLMTSIGITGLSEAIVNLSFYIWTRLLR